MNIKKLNNIVGSLKANEIKIVTAQFKSQQEQINEFIQQCKTSNTTEDYYTKQIDKNIQIWCQWYYGEYNTEIQFKKDNDKDFGDCCININDIVENGILDKYIKAQQNRIKKIGIDNYLEENKDYFL